MIVLDRGAAHDLAQAFSAPLLLLLRKIESRQDSFANGGLALAGQGLVINHGHTRSCPPHRA